MSPRKIETSDLRMLRHHLVSHITEQDRKDEARAAKSGRYFNIHALPLMLGAADEAVSRAEDLAARGTEPRRAFLLGLSRHFTATRTMHAFAKRIDPRVDVRRGEWIIP